MENREAVPAFHLPLDRAKYLSRCTTLARERMLSANAVDSETFLRTYHHLQAELNAEANNNRKQFIKVV